MKRLANVLVLILVMITGLSLFTGLAAAAVKLVKGQTLYLPCSTSYMSGDYSFQIRATIFIHNTDRKHAITVASMDFYNTSGKLVEKYLPHPLKLNPGAGTYVNVKNPLSGKPGAVAYFIVQWHAPTGVIPPIIRGLLLGTAGTRGFTFETRPRLVHEVD